MLSQAKGQAVMETAILFGFAVFGGGLLGFFVGRHSKMVDTEMAWHEGVAEGRRQQRAKAMSRDEKMAAFNAMTAKP